MRHSIEYRQGLGRQMDELSLDHDQFRQNLTEQMKANRNHSLLKQIDKWEQKAVDQIHQTADEIRQQLLTIISKHQKNLSATLTSITHELNQAHENFLNGNRRKNIRKYSNRRQWTSDCS
jgi:tRNA A37 N6-isopentenylltransferase MiaA